MRVHCKTTWRHALFICLLACLAIFAAQTVARAATVQWKHTATRVVNPNNSPSEVRLSITFYNVSNEEKKITSIYDKELYVEGTISIFRYGARTPPIPFKALIKSSKVSKVDVFPGDSTSMYFPVPRSAFHQSMINEQWTAPKVKITKLTFKYKYSTAPI